MTKRGWERCAVIFLLLLLVFQVVLAVTRNAPTADELAHHVASGFSYLVTGDFRMNPASPPLPRMLSGLPLLFTGVRAPLEDASWQAGDSPRFAHKFFYESGVSADVLIFWARMPILALALAFGWVLYGWTRSLWGPGAALAALALYVFCPDVLAHSGLATSDLAVAFFFFWAVRCFADYLQQPARGRLVGTGVTAGLTFLSKFTAVLLFPVLFLITLASGKIREAKPLRVAALVAVTFTIVWAGYFFEIKPLLENTPDPVKKAAVYHQYGGDALLSFAQHTPVPLATFVSAIVSMLHTRVQGTSAYLMGEWSRHGWWYYYFVAFTVKNTIPFVLLVLAAYAQIGRWKTDRVIQASLAVPVVFFFVVTLGDKAQAGIRYFLPIYPLACMAGGWLVAELWKRGGVRRALAVILLGWHVAEAIMVFPNHLTYFNEIAGGSSNGYRWLRDSNLDWGQGLKELAAVTREQGYGPMVLAYPWPADPGYYGISWRTITDAELQTPQAAVYAISAHTLDAVSWAKALRPTRMIANSIFVYDLRKNG